MMMMDNLWYVFCYLYFSMFDWIIKRSIKVISLCSVDQKLLDMVKSGAQNIVKAVHGKHKSRWKGMRKYENTRIVTWLLRHGKKWCAKYSTSCPVSHGKTQKSLKRNAVWKHQNCKLDLEEDIFRQDTFDSQH